MDRQFNSFHYYNNHYNNNKLMNILFSCFTLFSGGGVLSESDWLSGFSHSSQALIIHFFSILYQTIQNVLEKPIRYVLD